MNTTLKNRPYKRPFATYEEMEKIIADYYEWFWNLETELIQRQKNIENHLNSYNQGIYDFINELRGDEK